MNFEIEPYSGVGPVHFGMTSSEVRQAIGAEANPFRKGANSQVLTDAFIGLGIHVHYTSSGLCEAVEFGGSTIPTFQGRPLLGVPFLEVQQWLQTFDSTVESDDTGLTSVLLGVGIYMSSMDDLTEATEGVIVFRRGYYD